jgi:hypothetical protein
MLFLEIISKYGYQSIELRCIAYCFYFDKSPNLDRKNIHHFQIGTMNGRYTLEWLDSLITISLNPKRTNLEAILPEQITGLKLKIEEEKIEQQSFLKNEVFTLLEEKKIKLLINQYHSALVILLNQALKNYKNIPANNTLLNQLINEVITCVDELISFIEVRFPIYLKKEENVSVTCLSKTKKEVKQKTEKIRIELEKIKDEELVNILLNTLYSFCQSRKDSSRVTFQDVFYIKELLYQLEGLENNHSGNDIFSGLDKILIYLNFNCEEYLEYLTQKILKWIKSFESVNDKIDYLQFQLKEFNQLRNKPGIALYPQQTNLRDVITNWFTNEIYYLKQKILLPIPGLEIVPESPTHKSLIEKKKSKVLCIFSTDQMGIMLRAFDELKVLQARSMNEVFKTIVPHLSTPYKEELSYDSVRSKSYVAEERDKKIVIETLQQVIETIKRY